MRLTIIIFSSLLFILFNQSLVYAEDHNQSVEKRVANDSSELIITFTPGKATVGELTTISGEVRDKQNGLVPNVKVKITTHHVEDDKPMFSGEFLSLDGTFTWDNQFFDGAEHNVIVTASPTEESIQFEPITSEYLIDVEGYHPPKTIVVKTLLFLILITAISMMLAYVITKRWSQRSINNHAL
jgi:hypothetical protein